MQSERTRASYVTSIIWGSLATLNNRSLQRVFRHLDATRLLKRFRFCSNDLDSYIHGAR